MTQLNVAEIIAGSIRQKLGDSIDFDKVQEIAQDAAQEICNGMDIERR